MNVDGLLRGQAERNPDKVALVDGAVKVTWRALDEQVEELARGLAELGLVGGHRVAIALANSAEFVAGYLATLRGGLVAVPINPTSRPGEIARVLADSGARVCFADAGTVEVGPRGRVGPRRAGATRSWSSGPRPDPARSGMTTCRPWARRRSRRSTPSRSRCCSTPPGPAAGPGRPC